MSIDPRQLSVLLDVVRTGSFSSAAKLRNASQPAISLSVAQLERQVGTQLVERSKKGIKPTVAGSILVRRAEALEEQLHAAEVEIRLSAAGVEGPLKLAGPPGALLSLVPVALREMSQTSPSFSLEVVECPDAELLEMLRLAKIDLAITTTSVEGAPSDVIEIDIASDRFELVVGPENPVDVGGVKLEAVADLAWVLPQVGGTFRRHVDALFLAAGVRTPRNIVRCDSLATTKEIIRTSNYVTVLPHRVVAAELQSGMLRSVPILNFRLERRIGVRMLKANASSPLAAAFIAALRRAVV